MRTNKEKGGKKIVPVVLECVLFGVCMAALSVLRIRAALSVPANDYFELGATVQRLTPTGYIGENLYLLLLHGVLVFIRNDVLAAAMLQVVLQVCAAVFFYFVLRRTAGRVLALIALSLWGFSPYIIQIYEEISPGTFIFAVECLAMLLISGIWKHWNRDCDKGHPADALLRYVYIGIFVGLCCCMDISGVGTVLLLLWIILFGRNPIRDDEPALEGFWNNRIFIFVACFLAGALSFLGIQILVGTMAGSNLTNSLGLWKERFCPADSSILESLSEQEFLNVASLLYLFGIAAVGNAVRQLLRKAPEQVANLEDSEGKETSETQETPEVRKEEVGPVSVQEIENQETIHYIENPLPLPKKSDKKVMDFDYEVPNDDDFDIP